MGVSGLFAWLKDHWPYILWRMLRKSIPVRGAPGTKPERKEVPIFIGKYKIDGNALLHPAAQWAYGYGEYKGRQQGILDTLEVAGKMVPNPRIVDRRPASPQLAAERLMEIIMEGWDLLEPTRKADPKRKKLKSFYLALDGPAPSAKTQQQRTRRFLATARAMSNEEAVEDLEEGLKDAGGKTDVFDSSVISPGTPWMDAVDEYVRQWFKDNIEILPEDTRYWSHRTVGEGEHKLIATSQPEPGGGMSMKHTREEYDVIYGNDNDLIILCMMRTTKTLILRDALDKKKDAIRLAQYPSELGKLCLVDIDGLRSRLEREYNVTPADFSVICLLLGNDFVPTTPAAKDVFHTLDTTLKLYSDMKKNKPQTEAGKTDPVFALFTHKIRWDDLYFFIVNISKPEREQEMLAKVYLNEEFSNSEKNKGSEGKPPLITERTTALHKSVSLTANAEPVVNINKFRDLYWKKIFPNIDTSEDFGEVVVSVVDYYLQTMVWSSLYYASGVEAINLEYFMPYYYAPTLVEVAEVLRMYRGDPSRWETLPLDRSGKWLNPLEVLITILPLPVLNSVLYGEEDISDELRLKVFIPLRDLYPADVDIDGEGTYIPDKAIVRLPFVDPTRVREVAKTLKRPDIAAVESHPIKYPFAEVKSGRTKTGRITSSKKTA